MAKKGGKKDVDVEADYHGCTAEQMRHALERRWPEWRGMSRVRVIHGQGVSLRPELMQWCEAKGVPCVAEANNPGSTLLFPNQRTLPAAPRMGSTLADKGLRLTPEQEAELRNPEAVRRARQEELRRKQEEERKRREAEADQIAKQRRDEALWCSEMARLDAQDKNYAAKKRLAERDAKPATPVIIPPAVIKHQEGYWRSELVRVAETDTETLKKEKRTGLDKLAPPMEAKPPQAPTAAAPAAPATPTRDEAADRALFEAEMARLFDPAPPPNDKRR